jgi:hypothetical protein
MAPRDLDDDDALSTGAADTDPAEGRVADDAFRGVTAEQAPDSGGPRVPEIDETGGAELHTHASVDNRVEEVDVVLVGDAGDVVAALEALDTALEAADAGADDPAAVLRAAFRDRAAGPATSRAHEVADDVGYDASGYTDLLDADRDVDQDTTANQGMAT